MKRDLLLVALLLASWLLPAHQALAHKVNVFAYVEGHTIVGEARFSGGKSAKNVAVSLQETAGEKLLYTSQTDENGQFSMPLGQEIIASGSDLLVVVDASEGHRSQWLIKAAEYLPASKAATLEVISPSQESVAKDGSGAKQPAVDQDLEKLLAEIVARELRPVKQQLARLSVREADFRDILGGIGYIFGLVGIAAYIKANRKKEKLNPEQKRST